MIRKSAAALAACVVLAGCGGGGSDAPSALDPANAIPANSVLYVSATVRPHGAEGANLVQAIDSIAGKGAAQAARTKIEESLHGKWSQIKGWAGQRLGFALTGLPTSIAAGSSVDNYLVVVIPTNDPSAATTFFNNNTASLTKQNETWKVVGHYAFMGGQYGVGQALATTPKTSLAATSGYKADMAQLGGGDLISVYAQLHQFLAGILPLLNSNPEFRSSSLLSTERQDPPGSSAAVGLAALHNAFRLDIVTHGTPKTKGAAAPDIGALPGTSWLALSLGSLANVSELKEMLGAQQLVTTEGLGGATTGVPNPALQFLQKDLLPALGPATLSVSGTSAPTLQAGLIMSPLNRNAGPRLVTAVKQLVNGIPIDATTVGSRVVVTYGSDELAQLLNPSSRLADNPTFKQAVAQLPPGAKAAFYLNFGSLPLLATLGGSPPSASTMQVLQRINYVIAGGTHTHFRVVLAMH